MGILSPPTEIAVDAGARTIFDENDSITVTDLESDSDVHCTSQRQWRGTNGNLSTGTGELPIETNLNFFAVMLTDTNTLAFNDQFNATVQCACRDDAVDWLSRLHVPDLQSDTAKQLATDVALRDLVSFLEELLVLDPFEYLSGNDFTFISSIFQERFLSLILDIRRQCGHKVVFPFCRHGEVRTCWANIVLVVLGTVVLHLAGVNSGSGADNKAPINTLHLKEHENRLIAATQLPGTWSALVTLGSQYTSPGAAKLALSLCFGVFVLAPQISGCDPWSNGITSPSRLTQSLEQYIDRRQANHLNHVLGLEKYLEHGLVLGLYASADGALHTTNVSRVRPHTLATLLRLVEQIVQRVEQENTSPVKGHEICSVNGLLSCGSTVSWCWKMWNDQRVIDSAIITKLTRQWLCDLARCSSNAKSWQRVISKQVHLVPLAAARAMLRQCDYFAALLSAGGCATSQRKDVLLPVTWSLLQLFRSNEVLEEECLMGCCSSLCCLFVLLGTDEIDCQVKDMILHVLSSAGSKRVKIAVQHLEDESRFDFVSRLDFALSEDLPPSEQFRTLSPPAININLYLKFLAILWNSKMTGLRLPHSLELFFSGLFERLSSLDPTSTAYLIVQNSILASIASLAASENLDDTTFHRLFHSEWLPSLQVDIAVGNLPFSSVLAFHLISRKRGAYNLEPARELEMCIILQDTILLLLLGTQGCSYDPAALVPRVLALLLSTLSSFMGHTTPSVVAWMKTSPRTTQLKALIRAYHTHSLQRETRDRFIEEAAQRLRKQLSRLTKQSELVPDANGLCMSEAEVKEGSTIELICVGEYPTSVMCAVMYENRVT